MNDFKQTFYGEQSTGDGLIPRRMVESFIEVEGEPNIHCINYDPRYLMWLSRSYIDLLNIVERKNE